LTNNATYYHTERKTTFRKYLQTFETGTIHDQSAVRLVYSAVSTCVSNCVAFNRVKVHRFKLLFSALRQRLN